MGLAVDNSGNSYAVGYTDTGLNGNTQHGFQDTFLIKYASDGTLAWSKQWGGSTGYTIPFGVGVDPDTGDVMVGGYTTRALTGSQAGTNDAYWISVNPDGTTRQILQEGSSGKINRAQAIAFHHERPGDLLPEFAVTGYTNGSFDGRQAAGTKYFVGMSNGGGYDWSDVYGPAVGTAQSTAIGVDTSGNVLVTGFTTGAFLNQTQHGTRDGFIVKYNSTGSRQWATQFGAGIVGTSEIKADGSGNIFVYGNTDSGLGGNTRIGTSDCFLSKYDASGSLLWTKEYGSDGATLYCTHMVLDGSGHIYMAGQTPAVLHSATPSGTADAFFMKVDAVGDIAWVKMNGVPGASLSVQGFGILGNDLFAVTDLPGAPVKESLARLNLRQ